MISKELLSEILDKKAVVDDISNIELKENTITFIEDYCDEDEGSGFYRSHTINIYELAHKCKEWALSKGHYISLIIDEDDKTKCRYVLNLSWNDEYEVDFVIASEPYDTEPEAIFKACEYIMENKCGS